MTEENNELSHDRISQVACGGLPKNVQKKHYSVVNFSFSSLIPKNFIEKYWRNAENREFRIS